MSRTPLTDTQLIILSAAARRDDLRVTLPERLRGGAAKAVLVTLLARSLIQPNPQHDQPNGFAIPESSGQTAYRITQTGLNAIGTEIVDEGEGEGAIEGEDAPGPAGPAVGDRTSEALAAKTGSPSDRAPKNGPSPLPRAGSKLATVVALLKRAEGASIAELTAATGWLAHTTRAALTGLRKREYLIDRTRGNDGDPIYWVASQ